MCRLQKQDSRQQHERRQAYAVARGIPTMLRIRSFSSSWPSSYKVCIPLTSSVVALAQRTHRGEGNSAMDLAAWTLLCYIKSWDSGEGACKHAPAGNHIGNVEGSSMILHGFSFSDASQRAQVSDILWRANHQAVWSSLEAVSAKTNKLESAILVRMPPQCVALYSQLL